jgi:UDP-N-acetylglucosamine--N-acetylmuramyl-(pentapeptide) pyrophosphoryl-undecaprenol N-acetylglucosamine transferase
MGTAGTLLMAGGGTGGHVFPLIAVADELRRLRPDLRLIFVGTARGIETQVVPERGYELSLLNVLPIRGAGLTGALRGVWRAMNSVPEALKLLDKLKPSAVFSIGGYAAGPVSLAARLRGIPLALMEPNSVIGFANRAVAPLVTRAYTSFPQAEWHFAAPKVKRTGLALRGGFEPCDYEYAGGTLRILVLGGSQGAKSLNETVPRALSRVRLPFTVIHQAGKSHGVKVRELYDELGFGTPGSGRQATVTPFISDMQGALREADLVISRSGAGATSEICAVGRPALYIPYPFAAGDHQYENARSLAQAGAAAVLRASDASVERIAAEIERLTASPEVLPEMAKQARLLGRPDAAARVAEDLLSLAKIALPRPFQVSL